jgi:hypothetical protein
MESSTVRFATIARLLAAATRSHGLIAPGFRCPPRVVGVDRTIRRTRTGAVVSVRVQGRPWQAMVADMIEGIVATNGLAPPEADRIRTALWEAVAAGADDGRTSRVA